MKLPDRHILVFADWFEPGYRAGGPIRSVTNLVDRLDDMRFSVITRNCDHFDETPYEGIPTGKWVERKANVRVMYLSPEQRNMDFISKRVKLKRYDAIYFNSLFSPQFSLKPLLWLKMKGYDGRIILAPRGMLKSGALSVKSGKKTFFLALAKIFGLFKNIFWHATSDEEKQEIRSHFGEQAKVKVAPNLLSAGSTSLKKEEKKKGELRLVSIARVSPEKNTLQGIQFLEGLSANGKVVYDIYGTLQNEAYLEECKSAAQKIEGLVVNFHGPVAYPEVGPILEKAGFFYLPTLGENFGHSIVEAFIHGTPVIISNKTPWRDLHSKGIGWDLELEKSEFSTVLKDCLKMENEEYSQLCQKAHDFGNELIHNEDDIRRNRELFRY